METPIIPIPGFSEPVSSMTHLFGTAPFAVAAVFYIVRAVSKPFWGPRLFWLSILFFSSMFMLSMSGVYHMLEPGGTARMVLQRLDHAAIFVMIAGTFTAIHGILFRGWWRWGMLAMIWAAVAVAIPLKMVFFDGFTAIFGLTLYLLLGWLGLISGLKLWYRYGYRFIRFLLWGAIAYTVGAIVEFLERPVLIEGVFHAHEFFHVAVLVGLGCHWLFVWKFADGTVPLTKEERMKVSNAAGVQDIIHRGVPLVHDMGMKVEEVREGYARVRLPYATRLLRPGGSISGPALMSLVDTAMYALLLHDYGAEQMALTSDLQLRFLRRTPLSDAVAEARALKKGSRLVVVEVEIFGDGEKEPSAHATGTYMLPHEATIVPA